ncbi:hypothetical protein [Cryptosporangium sp. NPDC048952]|uniref:hypothetical protein n=1 Tax=Cryptosporangium sp. NPDC048952 TaxID=3363961 RepID=UPI00371B2408
MTRPGIAGRFDGVFLSLDEPRADDLFARLCQSLGPVKRLHGVRPMRRAYQLCAELADTEQFFLADGDFDIDPGFDPDSVEPLAPGTAMRVWQAHNPVNGLTYGYGGLKLIRSAALRDLGEAVDVLAALPGEIEFVGTPAGTTRIDQSAYHAWKAGFRECAMLARGCEYGATSTTSQQRRITAWTSGGTGPHADEAAFGAREGLTFAAASADDPIAWAQLNDPAWLRARFAESTGQVR